MIVPNLEDFSRLARLGNLIPIYREILADLETPVSAFLKINRGTTAFLLESIEGGEKWARYSFLGCGALAVFRSRGGYYEILQDDAVVEQGETQDPTQVLSELMARYRPVEVPGLPQLFWGGAVGYLGYDMVRFVESLPDHNPSEIGTWDSAFLLTESLLIFDNSRQKIKVVCNVHLQADEDPQAAYARGEQRIEEMIQRLRQPIPAAEAPQLRPDVDMAPNYAPTDFKKAVEKCKEYIRAGDIFQVVLSQRFSGELAAPPFDVYRALRTINPSPYMFFLHFDDTYVIGASPEVLVRLEGSRVDVRPIAGTRPRGATVEEDARLEKDLLADPKECAEHIMLVDLGRNDLGRVCRQGTVEVSELMVIERYSHVMHIVSNVRGEVEAGKDAFDVFRACFPAGTLSGAPKIRAMEIIDELEPCRREVYGGAVGYLSFAGNMDLAIAIRTLVVQGNRFYLQAGAGIVADSDPEMEYQETLNKAQGVRKAIELACAGLE